MTIADIRSRGKTLLERVPVRALLVLILLLATSAAFLLGILAGRDLERQAAGASGAGKGFWIEDRRLPANAGPAAVIEASGIPQTDAPEVSAATSGAFVASKNGSKYYLPSCSGAGRIKDTNKVWFATKAEAEAAGYTPASSCPGL